MELMLGFQERSLGADAGIKERSVLELMLGFQERSVWS